MLFMRFVLQKTRTLRVLFLYLKNVFRANHRRTDFCSKYGRLELLRHLNFYIAYSMYFRQPRGHTEQIFLSV